MYDQARSIYWISGLVDKYIPGAICMKKDEQRMLIVFKNGSTLEFAGSDNQRKYNKYRGAQFDGLIMDEFSDHDYAGWKAVFRYTIAAQADGSFTGGWVVFTGTVKGENHLWQEYLRTGPQRASFLFKASETKLLSEADIEDIRQECDGDESLMKQELECIPMFYSGLIYKEFGDHNFVKPFQIPADWGWTYGIDHGGNNATAFGVYRVDHEGNIYRVGEYYRSKSNIYVHAPQILQLKKTDDEIVADPSMFYGTQHRKVVNQGQISEKRFSIVDEYIEEGVTGFIAGNNDVLAGIQRCQKFLRFDPERIHPLTGQKGSPMFFVVEGSSPYFEFEIKSYRWKPMKEGSNDPEEPIKKDDHAMDEFRYVIMSRPDSAYESPKRSPTREESIRARLRKKSTDPDIEWDDDYTIQDYDNW